MDTNNVDTSTWTPGTDRHKKMGKHSLQLSTASRKGQVPSPILALSSDMSIPGSQTSANQSISLGPCIYVESLSPGHADSPDLSLGASSKGHNKLQPNTAPHSSGCCCHPSRTKPGNCTEPVSSHSTKLHC